MLALLFIFCDHRFQKFQRIRLDVAVVTLPVQYLVDAPIKVVGWFASTLETQRVLFQQNVALNEENLTLKLQVQKMLSLSKNNRQLHDLLKSASNIAGRILPAQLLAISLDPARQFFMLNKGVSRGVYSGQPVLDAYGVIGQVVQVGPLTSKVLLVTDTHSAVPIEDRRNGVRAIAVGMGAMKGLAVINVPDTSTIKVGDAFVTSGLGLRYPVGYPVGTVKAIHHLMGNRFATITLAPAAHLDRSQQVLLVWPSKARQQEAVEKALKAPLSNKGENDA